MLAMLPVRPFLAFTTLTVVFTLPSLHAADAAPDSGDAEVINLTTMAVDVKRADFAAMNLPAEAWDWRAGHAGDWEFMSSAKDDRTVKLLRRFTEFADLLHWMIPQWKRPSQPLRIIICGPRNTFEELRPSQKRRNHLNALTAYYPGTDFGYVVVDADNPVSFRDWGIVTQMSPPSGAARLGRFASSLPFSRSQEFVAYDRSVEATAFLKREYVRHLLLDQGWESPAWFTEGISRLVATARIDGKRARIGRLDALHVRSNSGTISELSLEFQKRAMIPLIKLFAVRYDDPAYLNPIGSTFSAQSLAFVHFCLYGANGRYQAALLNWANRLQFEPATEDAFQACFEVSTNDMGAQLRGYFNGGDYHSPVTDAGELPPPSPIFIADAAPAQVAVLKAQVHRLAGRPSAATEVLETALSRSFANAELHVTRAELALAAGDYAHAADCLAAANALDEPLTDRYRANRLEVEVLSAPQIDPVTGKRLIVDILHLQAQLPGRHQTFTRLLTEVFLRSPLRPDAAFVQSIEKRAARYPSDADLQSAVSQLHTKVAPIE